MNRKLLTADWHLTDNPRDEYRHQWQEELLSIVIKQQIDTLFILGDICEQKDYHSATLVNKVVNHLNLLSDHCHIKILMGNHDYSKIDNPFWDFLNCIPHVEFFKSNYVLDGILLLPHTRNWQKDWDVEVLKKYKLIFAHNTFDGAKGEHGHDLSGIPPNIFAEHSQVFAGDVHVPQTLGNITYVGAPYHKNFGETFAPRVIMLDDDMVPTSIACKGPHKMVAEFEYVDGKLKWLNKHVDFIVGDIVQGRVYIQRGDYDKWQEVVGKVHSWGMDVQCTIFQVVPIVEGGGTSQKFERTMSRRSDQQVYSDYVKRMKIDEETVKAGEGLL